MLGKTSNSEIGKTFLLSYLLVRRLHDSLPTIYRINDNMCFLFDEDSAGEETSMKV
jgi:hypothetical protein